MVFAVFQSVAKVFPSNHLLCTVHDGHGLIHCESFPVNRKVFSFEILLYTESNHVHTVQVHYSYNPPQVRYLCHYKSWRQSLGQVLITMIYLTSKVGFTGFYPVPYLPSVEYRAMNKPSILVNGCIKVNKSYVV